MSMHKKVKLSLKDFFSKCDQIRSFLQICSHILAKSLVKNFIFCVVVHGVTKHRDKTQGLKETIILK